MLLIHHGQCTELLPRAYYGVVKKGSALRIFDTVDRRENFRFFRAARQRQNGIVILIQSHDAEIISFGKPRDTGRSPCLCIFERISRHGTGMVDDDNHSYRRGIIDRLYGKHLLVQGSVHILTVIGVCHRLPGGIKFVSAYGEQTSAVIVDIRIQSLVEPFGHIGIGDIVQNDLIVSAESVDRQFLRLCGTDFLNFHVIGLIFCKYFLKSGRLSVHPF